MKATGMKGTTAMVDSCTTWTVATAELIPLRIGCRG